MTQILALYGDVFVRLLVATLLGLAVGLERSLAGKMAGMRTYGLVSLGSALFVAVGKLVGDGYLGLVNFDPLHVAAQIVVGVGFLGAGLIIFKESKLRGLTTAAGLWVSAGIGMAAGFGLFAIAIFTTILTLVVFTILWTVERRLEKLPIAETGPKTGEKTSSSDQ